MEHKLDLNKEPDGSIRAGIGKKNYKLQVDFVNEHEMLLNVDGRIFNAVISSNSTSRTVYLNGKNFRVQKRSASQILNHVREKQVRKDVKTSMPGKIIKILKKEGNHVDEGQAVLILEAMKMQNEIKSPRSGTLTCIRPSPGDTVEAGVLLFTVE